MPGTPTFIPDVPRLLKARIQVASLLGREGSASIPAFIAWKAFLTMAHAQVGDTERARCQACTEAAASYAPQEMDDPLRSFIVSLQHFREAPTSTVAAWFLTPEERDFMGQSEVDDRCKKIVRGVKRLGEAVQSLRRGGLAPAAEEIGARLYDVRNSVLAHVSVLSSGNLYSIVVPAFDRAVAAVALSAWAAGAGIPLRDAAAQIGLDRV